MSLNDPNLTDLAAAVVTGGSSGLGEAFIRLLRTLGTAVPVCNLSRRPCAEKTGANFQPPPHHVPCDLADPAALARAAAAVTAWLEAAPAGPVLLVNNAGLGAFGRFPGDDPARQLAIIDVNVRAVVDLTARLLPVLRARGGGILNVASVVAYQPTPYAATYGASKAFLLSWSLALREELRGSGLRVTACCPGTTATGFFDAAGLDRLPGAAMGAEEVARVAWRAWARDGPPAVPGRPLRGLTWAGSCRPRPAA
ncbi:MAG: SDR family NAD(P)-dependent oxidoreductase, partial [Verrucomicrobiota bacterium]